MASYGKFEFDFETGPTWMNAKNDFHSSDFFYIDPINKLDDPIKGVEFEIVNDRWLLVGGPSCAIAVTGYFAYATQAEPNLWVPCGPEEAENVMVCPNWLGQLIKEETIFHGNNVVKMHSEAPNVAPFLDTYLMSRMNRDDKKFYSPEDVHPANGVPTLLGAEGWAHGANTEWTKYGKKIFNGVLCTFHYKPLHNFLFYQGCNEFIDGLTSNALPMAAIGKLQYKITFHEMDRIFNIKAVVPANTKKYAFKFSSIQLVLSVARLSANFDRQLSSKKMRLPYKGVTRMMIAENIPFEATTHRCRFQNIYMPEGLFIFAVNKNVVNNTWRYDQDGGANGSVFAPHDIKEVHLNFGGQPFYYKAPNFGVLTDHAQKLQTIQDYLLNPPFGMLQDEKQISLSHLEGNGANTPFPSVYLNLVNGDKGRKRTVNAVDLSKRHDLDIYIIFHDGATKDVTYCLYLFFTDYVLVYANGMFTPFYIPS
jgi:hypothetical protein